MGHFNELSMEVGTPRLAPAVELPGIVAADGERPSDYRIVANDATGAQIRYFSTSGEAHRAARRLRASGRYRVYTQSWHHTEQRWIG